MSDLLNTADVPRRREPGPLLPRIDFVRQFVADSTAGQCRRLPLKPSETEQRPSRVLGFWSKAVMTVRDETGVDLSVWTGADGNYYISNQGEVAA